MQSRTWTAVVVGAIILSAAVGLALLVLGSEPMAAPTPSPRPATDLAPTVALGPSPTSPPSSTPRPLLYTIQEGDTLGSIAASHGVSLEDLVAANGLSDPNLIQAGQVLIIPGMAAPAPIGSPTPVPPFPTAPFSTPLPTPTLSGPPLVEIAGVLGAGNLEAEVVRVRNRGGAASLEGWTLSSAVGNSFTFPRLVLFPEGEVTIHSGPGQSTPLHLYWGRAEPAWESAGLITLRDGEGAVVDTYIVP